MPNPMKMPNAIKKNQITRTDEENSRFFLLLRRMTCPEERKKSFNVQMGKGKKAWKWNELELPKIEDVRLKILCVAHFAIRRDL